MSDAPTILLTLSDLRPLWRQAKSAWMECYSSPFSSIFRGYVREEIARRTTASYVVRIDTLRAQIDRQNAELVEKQIYILRLERELGEGGSWELVPDGRYYDEDDALEIEIERGGRTILVWTDGDEEPFTVPYDLQDGWRLCRRATSAADAGGDAA